MLGNCFEVEEIMFYVYIGFLLLNLCKNCIALAVYEIKIELNQI
jgi:hypothetical protein